MGRAGSCNTCCRRDRQTIDDAHRSGAPTRDLARTYGIPESSLRKHFKHVRPKARHAAVSVSAPNLVTMGRLRRVAAEFDVPIVDLIFHQIHCRKGDIELVSDAEGDELLEMMRQHATPEEFAEMFPA